MTGPRLVSDWQLRFAVGGVACFDQPSAFKFGVELGAKEDHRVGDPQPDQEQDDADAGHSATSRAAMTRMPAVPR